jgi:methionyl-tRNA synthetase
MMNKTFYVTTPIYYPSGKLHIGNAYTTIFCDVLKRYKKYQGYETFYLTGMDEHGKKVESKAIENNIPTQEYVDQIAEETKDLWHLLNIDYDDFIRTTEKRHKTVVQTFFQKLLDQKDIYLGHYEGHYCMHCESFFTETQVGEEKVCPDCHRPTQLLKEESYFLKLSKYEKKLLEHIKNNPDFITPESRRNEVIAFIEGGLNDLSVSRTTFDWGIKVVSDPKHVVYVWLDALTNYLSALGVISPDNPLYQKYWLGDEVLHVVGKDILRFHAIYWPIMLMALDLPVTFKLHAHGWYMMKDGKMSKSKGGAIYPETFVKRYGLDALRYYMIRELPYGGDGLFAPDAFLEKLNFDLANDFGNLVNRSTAMIKQYFDGEIHQKSAQTEFDSSLEEAILQTVIAYDASMDVFKVSEAIGHVFALISRTNKYVDETTPWVLAKDETKHEVLENVLYRLSEALRIVTILLRPVLLESTEKVFEMFNIESHHQSFESRVYGLKTDYIVTQNKEPLFPRIDINEEVESLKEASSPQLKTLKHPLAEEITIDTFTQIDLRVGKVLACKKHPNADLLLVSTVDCGEASPRQIVSGIASHYSPEDMVGKKVIIVANLKPVTLRGELSQGMLLAGSNDEALEVIELNGLEPGDRIK